MPMLPCRRPSLAHKAGPLIHRFLACMLRDRRPGSRVRRSGGHMRKDVDKSGAIVRNRLSRRNFVAAAGAGAVVAGTGFAPKKVYAQKKVTVKYTLGWLPEGANIWSYAAKQFWTKAGIDVVIEKGTGSAAATQAIAQGKYEFGVPAAPNSIQQAGKGLPLLSLGCFDYDKEKALCEAMTMGLSEGVKFALLNPAETIEILFKEVPELKLASTAKEQLEIGMGVWAANYVSKEAMDKGVGYADPAVYAKMTDLIFEKAGAAGDKKPDPSAPHPNEVVGKQ